MKLIFLTVPQINSLFNGIVSPYLGQGGGEACQNEKWKTHASEIETNNMWKHLRGLKLLKWQIYWDQKAVCRGRKRRKRETGSILWPFQSCVLKQNKKKFKKNWKVANLMPLFHRA